MTEPGIDPTPAVSTNHLLHLINDIERATTFLAAQPATREIGSHIRSGNKPGSREPVSLELLDAKREIPEAIGTMADKVYSERIKAGVSQIGDGTEDSAFLYLRSQAAWTATQPWADDLTAELTDLRHRLQRIPGSPLLRPTIERVACPNCGDVVIVQAHDRGAHIEWAARCTGCHQSLTDTAVEKAKTQSLRRLNWRPAAEIVDTLRTEGLHVTPTQIRTWADRGHIADDTTDPDRQDTDPRRFLTDQVRERAQPAQRHAQVRAHLDAQQDTA